MLGNCEFQKLHKSRFFSRELFCSSADIQNRPPSLSRTELRIIRVWERPLIFLFLVYFPALPPCLGLSKLKNTKHYLVFTEGLNLAFFPSHTFYFENSAGVLSWKQLCMLPRPSVLWLQPHENTSFSEFSVPLWPSVNQAQNQQMSGGKSKVISSRQQVPSPDGKLLPCCVKQLCGAFRTWPSWVR